MVFFFFFKQKTAYEMRISDWSSDVCSSDLDGNFAARRLGQARAVRVAAGELDDRAAGEAGHRQLGARVGPDRRVGLQLEPCDHRARIVGRQLQALDGADRNDVVLHAAAVGRSEEHTSELKSLMRISY